MTYHNTTRFALQQNVSSGVRYIFVFLCVIYVAGYFAVSVRVLCWPMYFLSCLRVVLLVVTLSVKVE